MTTIKAETVLRSRNVVTGDVLTTMKLRYPRFIHAQVMTYRMWSRNAQSSRAMPTNRMLQQIRQDMAVPIRWGQYQSGMQCHNELTPVRRICADLCWGLAGHTAMFWCWVMRKIGLGKEHLNRIVEPYAHITVLVSATEWDNFLNQRLHEDAQPEIQELAQAINFELQTAPIQNLSPGEWHLPFVDANGLRSVLSTEEMVYISAARSARVSYDRLDGRQPDHAADIELAKKLHAKKHLSPWEHPAVATDSDLVYTANYKGFLQARKNKEYEL